jgi:uncharacterized membrane protein
LLKSAAYDNRRLHFVDGFRALALLMMVSTHGFKAWVEPSLWTGTPLLIRTYATRIPGAIFFFLVGISYVLSRIGKVQKGQTPNEILSSFLKRGIQLLLLAYVYKAIDMIFGIQWQYIRIWLVDVLNIISVSLIFIAVLDYLLSTFSGSKVWWFIFAVIALIGEPIMFGITFPSWFPDPLRWYFQGVPPNAHFTLFPFIGLAIFGVFAGEELSKRNFDAPFLGLYKIALYPFVTIVLCALIELTDIFETKDVVRVSYFLKGFILLLLGLWLCYKFQKHVGFGPILILGSHTMIGYWFHAKWEFIYYKEYLFKQTWSEAGWLLLKTYLVTVAVVLVYAKIKRHIVKMRKAKNP